jgi:hypothetical protein
LVNCLNRAEFPNIISSIEFNIELGFLTKLLEDMENAVLTQGLISSEFLKVHWRKGKR